MLLTRDTVRESFSIYGEFENKIDRRSGRFLFFIKIMRVRSLFFRGHSHLYTYFDSRVCACMRTCLLARGGAFMYTVWAACL